MAGSWIVGQLILEGVHETFTEALYEPMRGHLGRVRAGAGGVGLGEGLGWTTCWMFRPGPGVVCACARRNSFWIECGSYLIS